MLYIECTQVGRKNQYHHPHFTQVETEATRSSVVAEPVVYQEPGSRTWFLTTVLSVRSSVGTVPSTLHKWCVVAHRGCQRMWAFVGNDGFHESLAGETTFGKPCEVVGRMLLTAFSAEQIHKWPFPGIYYLCS